MSDREIVEQVIRSGDTRGFAEIVNRYSGCVYSKALQLTRRQDWAADVTQQTFIKAYTRLTCWRGEKLAPWLITIAIHTALECLDREGRRQGIPIDQLTETDIGENEDYSAEREEQLQRMEQAIDQLPEGDRTLIEMHYMQEMKTEEIARKTGLSQSNVLVKLHRIRERLKKQLTHE